VDALAEVERGRELYALHDRILVASPAASRYVDLRSGRRVHVIEACEGPPAVLLRGSGTSSLSQVPLLKRR
jgi:hypothetical protein